METIEHRAVIKFLTLQGKQADAILNEMTSVYGTEAPSLRTIQKWVSLFKRGRTSLEDDPREGRPRTSRTDENVAAVLHLVRQDRRITISVIEESLHISAGTIVSILHEDLQMRKISARWVPKLLSDENKTERVEIAMEVLSRYNANPADFEKRLVTGDETWCYHYDPTTKQESMEWKGPGELTSVKAKRARSAGKVMGVFFWDTEGIVHLEFLPSGQTVTGAFYATVLARLHQALLSKRKGKLHKPILLLQDNAPAHRSQVATDAATQNRFQILPHPPYSPDLAPSDYHLFRHMKKALRGKSFSSNQEVMTAAEEWCNSQPTDFFLTGIRALKDRYQKCIDVDGGYVEK